MNAAEAKAGESLSTKASGRTQTLLILACSLVSVPLVLNKDLYWDDWSLFWIYWVEGPSSLFQLYEEVRRIGHWPPVAVFLNLGGGYVGVLARSLAVVCHALNAILLYRILGQMRLTSEISVWIACLYALSPFYYGRGLLLLAGIDLFLLCYLLSIWFLSYQRRHFDIMALLFFVLSMGHETFLFLEPLRVLFLYDTRKDLPTVIRTCLPFWIIGITFTILRGTLLKPYGHWASYNQLFSFDTYYLFRVLVGTGLFYFRALWFDLKCAVGFAGW